MTDAAPSPQQAQEPSMEEILASIRRIISQDGDAKPADAKPAEAKPAEAKPAEPAKPTAPAPVPSAPAPPPPAAAAPEEDVLELTEVAEEEPLPRVAPAPLVPAQPEDGLLSADSASAAAAAFASLADTGGEKPMTQPLPLGDGTRTIEDVVRELLRPMLKSWLDENLPTMVERMVRSEIDRVARRG
jgi:hypothetical protein